MWIFEEVKLDWFVFMFVIVECVLVYLLSGKLDEVVRFFGERVERGAFILYDFIEFDDVFG